MQATQRLRVLRRTPSAGVINERDQSGLPLRIAGGDIRATHGVGLPELVGVLHAEREAAPALGGIRLEQFVLTDETEE